MGTPLDSWLSTVSQTKYTGKTYAVNFGPFPFTPTESSLARVKPLLKEYGDITRITIYADRTVTFGFALGDRRMPTTRKRLPLIISGKCVGVLMAPFHIKMMGVKACKFCPAMGDVLAHTPACQVNKDAREQFLVRKNKKTAALAATARGERTGPPQMAPGEIPPPLHNPGRHVLARLSGQVEALHRADA